MQMTHIYNTYTVALANVYLVFPFFFFYVPTYTTLPIIHITFNSLVCLNKNKENCNLNFYIVDDNYRFVTNFFFIEHFKIVFIYKLNISKMF